ncbi:MAG: hypothetical protein V3V96_15425 [Acidiferrobacterales bacterium]
MSAAKTKPAQFGKAVTVSDTTNIDFDDKSYQTRGLYVGEGGDLSVEMAGDNGRGGGMADPTVILPFVQSGSFLPIEVTRVNDTGTTAASIVAFW